MKTRFDNVHTALLTVAMAAMLALVYLTLNQDSQLQEAKNSEYSRGFSDCKQQGVGDMRQFIQDHASCMVKLNGTQAQCKVTMNYMVG